MKKPFSMTVIVIALLVLTGAVALAAGLRFGILDYLPEQADNKPYVESILPLDQEWDGEYFSAAIHEAVFDGMKMTFTMSITPKEEADPVYVIPRIRATAGGQSLNPQIFASNGFSEDGFWVPDIMPTFGYDYDEWAVEVVLTDHNPDWSYAPTAEDVQWEIAFDVLHTDWPLIFTPEEEYYLDEAELSEEWWAEYEQRFRTAYASKQVLMDGDGNFRYWLDAVREQQEDESYADYCRAAMTAEAFTLTEQVPFRFTTAGRPVRTASSSVEFNTPDGFHVQLTDLNVSASQIGMTLRITRFEGETSQSLYEAWTGGFALMAEDGKTFPESGSLCQMEDGSLEYKAHVRLEGETSKLILMFFSDPFAQTTVETADGLTTLSLDYALMQKLIPMNEEQEKQAVTIELE